MSPKSGLTIAIIGTTGNVGRKVVEMLVERNIVPDINLQLYASKKSTGKNIQVKNHEWKVQDTDNIDFSTIQLALFATDTDVSRQYVSRALKNRTIVIDSSSLHRLDASVPLIVAPVNKHLVLTDNTRLYAIANCVSSPIATVVAPLHCQHKVKRIIASTYQSTSGAGKDAMDELEHETMALLQGKRFNRTSFKRQIAFNIIPQVDRIMEDGFTYEEFKIMKEVQKIVGGKFSITATAVRVPVRIGHSISLSVEFDKEVSIKEVQALLANATGVKLSNDEYSTPVEVVGTDDVHVGRLRKDPSTEHGIQMWLCSDNLRRGAATDMVEVAEEIIRQLK